VLPRCRLAVTPLHLIPRVGGHRAVPPQPPHHLRQDRPAELLPVPVHPPRVVHVVPLLREGLHQPHVLVEPVPRLVVPAVAEAAVPAGGGGWVRRPPRRQGSGGPLPPGPPPLPRGGGPPPGGGGGCRLSPPPPGGGGPPPGRR